MKNIFRLAVVSLLLVILSGCTKPDDSKRLLESSGMQDVVITGYSFFGCSEDDIYHTGFTAKAVNGSNISGTVCSGLLFKGATIRYD